jgi:hypothetical protein
MFGSHVHDEEASNCSTCFLGFVDVAAPFAVVRVSLQS